MVFMVLRRRLYLGARLQSYLMKMLRLLGTLVLPSSAMLTYFGISEAVTKVLPLLLVSSFPLGMRNIELIGLLPRIFVNLT